MNLNRKWLLLVSVLSCLVLLANPMGARAADQTAKVVAVSAGYNHSLALKNDGTVWSWGNNDYGQLGNGTTIMQVNARKIEGVSRITAISAGKQYSMALDTNGEVWVWGHYSKASSIDKDRVQSKEGQLSLKPVKLPYAADIIAISAGSSHALLLSRDYRLLSWGDNTLNQIASTADLNEKMLGSPTVLKNPYDITRLSAGASHSVALDKDDNLWVWGAASAGFYDAPQKMGSFRNAKKVAAAWGESGHGYPGEDTYVVDQSSKLYLITEDAAYPRLIAEQIIDFGAKDSDIVMLQSSGHVLFSAQKQDPAAVQQLHNIVQVAAGQHFFLALQDDGAVWAWGSGSDSNGGGQLGDGTTSNHTAPSKVHGLGAGDEQSSFFNDISGHWAERDINLLAEKQIIDGKPDGSFGPNETVTRAQFVKMLLSSNPGKYKTVTGKQTFTDIPEWANKYIEGAVVSGIISKEQFGSEFHPDQPVTRLEMAIMVGNVVGGFNGGELTNVFKDSGEIMNRLNNIFPQDVPKRNERLSTIVGQLNYLFGNHIIDGFGDGTFQPQSTLTRAQAAAVISKIMRNV